MDQEPGLKFCSVCASALLHQIPPGDSRVRAVCPACGTIHYVNPKIVVGTLPVAADGRILLCRRAIEPRLGFWTLPAGFMEVDETMAQGAERETSEEAGARVRMGPLYSVIDVPHVNQVHMFYRADLLDLDFAPGEESLEVAMFEAADIPWPEIAFRTVAKTLQWFIDDRTRGAFELHTDVVSYPPRPAT
jgi:ADP-ribose pyrophosphatase YjhB (NUDIX family)